MKPIKLEWVDRIRNRMIEVGHSGANNEIVLHPEAEKFIRPILEYGEAEEKRITKEFRRKRK